MRIANNLINSAGLIIINKKGQILLLKPKGLPEGQYSIPKGIVEKNESFKKAAIREAYEEVGIEINIKNLGKQYVVDYYNKSFLTKRVYCYLVQLSKEQELAFIPKIQEDEVDSCDFYSRQEFENLIFWRFKQLFNINEIWH